MERRVTIAVPGQEPVVAESAQAFLDNYWWPAHCDLQPRKTQVVVIPHTSGGTPDHRRAVAYTALSRPGKYVAVAVSALTYHLMATQTFAEAVAVCTARTVIEEDFCAPNFCIVVHKPTAKTYQILHHSINYNDCAIEVSEEAAVVVCLAHAANFDGMFAAAESAPVSAAERTRAQCLVCHDAPPAYAFVHAASAHLGVCETCLGSYRPVRCPVCATHIDKIVRVHTVTFPDHDDDDE